MVHNCRIAQKIITQLVDDMTGEEITEGEGETVAFALDGQSYTIDLSLKNADKFRGLFQDHIAVAAKVGRKASTGGCSAVSRSTASGPPVKEVREWARSNGIDVPEHGRIPAEVRDAFEAAN